MVVRGSKRWFYEFSTTLHWEVIVKPSMEMNFDESSKESIYTGTIHLDELSSNHLNKEDLFKKARKTFKKQIAETDKGGDLRLDFPHAVLCCRKATNTQTDIYPHIVTPSHTSFTKATSDSLPAPHQHWLCAQVWTWL